MTATISTARPGRAFALTVATFLLATSTSVFLPMRSADAAADWCPPDQQPLVKFEWAKAQGGTFVPEGGDPEGVTVTASEFKLEDGVPDTLEPIAASWTSQVPIDLVLVKAGNTDPFPYPYDGAHAGEVWSPNDHAISWVAFCYLDGEPPPPDLAIELLKLNDADEDGIFSDVEEVKGAGRPVTFQVTVTNTSDVPMTVTALTDTMLETTLDVLDEPYCPAFDGMTLDPEDSETCTFTLDAYLRDYGDQPRDELTNVMEVTATDGETAVTDDDDSTVVNPNAQKVSVEVDKTNDADGDGTFSDDEYAPVPGADVTLQVVVRNTSPGSVVLTELTDTWPGLDEPIDLFGFCPDLDGVKLSGAGHGDGDGDHEDGGHEKVTSVTCTFTLEGYAPPAGESLTDTVTVTVGKQHSPERTATDTDSSTVRTPAEQVVTNPAIVLEKRVGPAAIGPFGDQDEPPGLNVAIPSTGVSVWYELAVTNTGDTTLRDIALEDAQVDLSACDIPASLAHGGTFECLVGPVAAAVGDHVNSATVTATGGGRTVTATDVAHYRGAAVAPAVVERPDITLTKSAEVIPAADGVTYVRYDPLDDDEETVTYVFGITNSGETPLSQVTLTDDRIGEIVLPTTSLPVGGTLTVRASDIVGAGDAAAGTIRNTATVRGTAPDGTSVSDQATEQIAVVEVEPAVISRPPAPAPAPASQPAPLPRTGAPVLLLGILGLASLTGGALLVRTGRRSRWWDLRTADRGSCASGYPSGCNCPTSS